MSLNIKNEETCRLTGELAHLTGETMTGAITVALRERLERERRQHGVDARLRKMRVIAERSAFLEEAEIELAPVTPDHAQAARRAWRRFGKGNHPAGLNFGDCFAYALAEATQEPFLFKGRDFALTDIEAA